MCFGDKKYKAGDNLFENEDEKFKKGDNTLDIRYLRFLFIYLPF